MTTNQTTAPRRMFLMTYGETFSYRSIDEMEQAVRECNPETAFNDPEECDRVMALHGVDFLDAIGVEWEELTPTDDPEIWIAERTRHRGGARYEAETTRYRCVDGDAEEIEEEEE